MNEQMVCPFCKSVLQPSVLDLKRCSGCGLYRKAVLPLKEEILERLKTMMLRACFDESKLKSRMRDAARQVDILSWYTSPGRLYDVGAAAGFFMKAARDAGWKVEGNEVSQDAIVWAKEHYGLDISYGLLHDLERPLEADAYDAVVLWNTLEHVLYPERILATCKTILKIGGLLFIEVPTKNEEEIVEDYESAHMSEFGVDNLRLYIEGIGFTTLEEIVFRGGGKHHVNLLFKKESDSGC